MPLFEEGDVVVLKSGGPPMTISSVPVNDRDLYNCKWFKGASAESANFKEHVLMKFEPPKK